VEQLIHGQSYSRQLRRLTDANQPWPEAEFAQFQYQAALAREDGNGPPVAVASITRINANASIIFGFTQAQILSLPANRKYLFDFVETTPSGASVILRGIWPVLPGASL
jgi:hypothetical protein